MTRPIDYKALHTRLHQLRVSKPTDYADYGGEVKRWERNDVAYPDCSGGCAHAVELSAPGVGADWVVCGRKDGPRFGLVTFEHQAGFGCFEYRDDQCPNCGGACDSAKTALGTFCRCRECGHGFSRDTLAGGDDE